ncbi:putative AraC-type DNA-binding domain-containing protein [Vibrio nigripulchritudo SFn27]|uniref:Putative AraC-type DNA-binding domain-containing protein n=1 Tax=Vibrio nigripulchritudo TaxID=28173 RepID=U4KD91_9VIBR|nr:AraC family transcriptional regulator [Vibrio nigripulchritudo]CCN81528.1 putative AraC-type DNA-binding domain-containing protein [Vibrio nigripulchritudo BLFn1]CCN91625.1 putative AraC-type DNA-binding domain-containing protein [Vibrio nigripulchritudo SFn27]CCN96509.1 putative AraC-type DNA-binding domain-containing protein [Vibrio nigripulchritudo ENn2]CCO38383.1 putative AraC-type DNA-binding domain-containing protein [Vibrio nigripulchritudo SFn135]CCO53840.1 putative AraC-type DNA-bi
MTSANDVSKTPLREPVAITQFVDSGSEKQSVITCNQSKPDVLVEGQFVSYKSKDGITVHGGETLDLASRHIVATSPSSVIITVLLKGKLVFGYDDLHFELDAINAPQAVVTNLKKPATFHKRTLKGNCVEKINIVIKPEWFNARLELSSGDSLWAFLNADKSHQIINIDQNILSLIQPILDMRKPQSLTETLMFESHALQVMSLVFEQVASGAHASNQREQPFQLNGDITHLITYLESKLDEDLTLETIASYAAMSVSNLQRRFKQEVGYTVLGYIRYRRLARAKQALDQGYKTITEAAYDAGYQHPSNFTNAFKKQFGYSPSDSMSLVNAG